MTIRIRTAALPFALLTLTLAGCGLGDNTRKCTLIGGVPGISVSYEPGAEAKDPGPVVLRLCADGRCEERAQGAGEAFATMRVLVPDDVRDKELDVRFKVTTVEGGRVVMDDSAKVRMTEHWPNGKACDKEGTWQASLTAAPGTGLVAR
ncbi:hypothetical protein J7I98_05385 [Streptomyces sp. ISL-98]|uniref:hypothetical protein n=1 Tax=Streptomyces sp. ISL-98 TaxID=2819192 RepID=UPI001BEA54DE|nr:hypothetical protein [Streptomyces sp. ISL-98]MBT2505340.1 hypothetical protein [Streptomyces sp. ISL-98]